METEVLIRPLHKSCRDIASLSTGGVVVGSYKGDVVLYNADLKQICALPVPDDVIIWSPRWLTTTQNDDIIVGNCTSVDDGGGLYSYNKDGTYFRKVISFHYPRGIATSEYTLYVLSGEYTGCLDIYDMIKYENIGIDLYHVRRREDSELFDANYLTVNPENNDAIICHDSGVTCLTEDLKTRWTFKCGESDQKGYLRRGAGVSIKSQVYVYVADVSSGRIVQLSADQGLHIRSFYSPKPHGLSGLTIDQQDRLHVVNFDKAELYTYQLKNDLIPGKRNLAKAEFSYTPENGDEIALEEGDIVEVIKEHESGWYYGKKGDKEGVFPSNFVELIKADDADH